MERKLNVIQKRNVMNDIYSLDEIGPGGGNHCYQVRRDGKPVADIVFQTGPRNEEGSTTGVLNVDLLEIVRDQLKAFQAGPYSCRENACALTKIEEALMWLNMRQEDRSERGVLGKNAK